MAARWRAATLKRVTTNSCVTTSPIARGAVRATANRIAQLRPGKNVRGSRVRRCVDNVLGLHYALAVGLVASADAPIGQQHPARGNEPCSDGG